MADYPLIAGRWTGNKVGDAWVGGKFKVFEGGGKNMPIGVAVRGQVKLPMGDDKIGVSSGKADYQIDGIVSGYTKRLRCPASAATSPEGTRRTSC